MASLTILVDGKPVTRHPLRQAETRVGRSRLNDLQVLDETVSRFHFVVRHAGGVFWAVGVAGQGIAVNGDKVDEKALADGDEIAFGASTARFVLNDPQDVADRATDIRVRPTTDVLSCSQDAGSVVTTRGFVKLPDGRTVELQGSSVSIGSDETTQIRLPEKYVSGFHCTVYKKRGQFFVRDNGSTNGTFVNKRRVGESELADGDVIRLGKIEITFTMSEETQKVGSGGPAAFCGMVGASEAMRKVFELVRLVAPSDATVLITGETGTGKELVARALHDLSGRPATVYVTLNCAAFARELVESELFGHEKGAFTGAQSARKGAFEEADGGTIFLDEMGELPLDLQAKVLRVVEYGDLKRVGANKSIAVKPRIVAATNRDLPVEIKAGKFRSDLYYRLDKIHVNLPPLRDRGDDVLAIAEALLARCLGPRKTLGDAARAALKTYDWPGNVRELDNVISNAARFAKSKEIGPRDLDLKTADLEDRLEYARTFFKGRTMEEIEREAIEDAVRRHDGDKRAAAKELGIGFSTLKGKMKERENTRTTGK